MVADTRFLFVVCQAGAEGALKHEVAGAWPAFRLAFSRPGFVTFKLPPAMHLAEDFDLGCTLARASGFSIGKLRVGTAESGAREFWRMAGDQPVQQLHVWQRDAGVPGDRGFEPGCTPLADEIGAILAAAGSNPHRDSARLPVNQHARRGERILDCVLVEPNEWWLGWHLATGPASSWPGGVPNFKRRPGVISRAYYKLHEALAWSRLPLRAGDQCAEIGCAPGGAVQALLDKGLTVLGIDPAEMDESLLGNPHFKQLRKRVAAVKRREFRDVKWLFVDSNVTPQNTLDDVETIVMHREVRVRGLILTLKLSDWNVLDALPRFIERVRSWGFDDVATRQLAFNRREVCLAARKQAAGGRRVPGKPTS